MGDADRRKINLLGARSHLHPARIGDLPELSAKVEEEVVVGDMDISLFQILLVLSVNIHDADNALFGISLQLVCNAAERPQVILGAVLVAEKDGIVTPDHPFGSDLFREPFESGEDDRLFVGDVPLDVLAIRGDGKLKVILIRTELIQLVEDVGRIFCPEYDTVDDVRSQWNSADLMDVHRISDTDKALLDAVDEPVRVVIGDIRAAACTDNHV